MAEAVISVAVKMLASNALDQIIEEVRLDKGVPEKVENLKRNLRSIQTVIQDAERKRWTNSSDSESVKDWLETLEDDALEMGDVLDRWNTLFLKSQVESENPNKKVNFLLSSCFCFPKVNQLISHREIALEIKKLDERVTKTAEEMGKLNLMRSIMGATPNIQVEGWRVETISSIDKTEIHGRKEDEKALLRLLLSESGHGQGKLEVIAIVGMGGLGKTTLAQLALDNEIVKNHFPKKIWVCVSEPFDLPKIVSAITEILYRDNPTQTQDENDSAGQTQRNEPPKFQALEGALKWISARLGKSRFLLVLDDVWNEDYNKWKQLEITLKNLAPVGSKVLVTTRKKNVAKVMGAGSRMINLKEMTDAECQIIFEQRAFKEKTEEEINELRDIGMQIVKKCKGLPLAASTLGGLMQCKGTREEWEYILHSPLWELNVAEVDEHLFGPLLLSYLDLPPLEKRCLLHCSIFPKDHLINRRQLIELWMSEGFLRSENEGASIFQTLAMRSFFQDFQEQEDLYNEGNVVCKMHDILHDFIHYLTKTECEIIEFLNINLDERKSLKLGKRTRHLTIAMESEAQFPDLMLSEDNKRFLHSFLILRQGGDVSLDISVFTSLKHLRTLNLSNCGFDNLPENIGNLIHLRYLELSNNPLVNLPDTICNLCNLQTLKLESGCESLLELPEGMGKLVNLRALYLWGCSYKFKGLPKGISRLTSLQVLDWFQVPKDGKEHLTVRELTKMNCKLKINQLTLRLDRLVNTENAAEANKIDLTTWEYLNEIVIYPANESGFDGAIEFLEPHPKLKVLKVRNSASHTFSSRWMMSLNLLREIEFYGCHGLRTLPAAIGKLPSLESLHYWGLNHSIRVGPELFGIIEDGQVPFNTLYPKLKLLKFTSADNWEEWETEAPATNPGLQIMPRLETLYFWHCPKLRVLPGFLQTVPLQFLHNDFASADFVYCCRARKGNEWSKISHVKNILINGVHVQKDGRHQDDAY